MGVGGVGWTGSKGGDGDSDGGDPQSPLRTSIGGGAATGGVEMTEVSLHDAEDERDGAPLLGASRV